MVRVDGGLRESVEHSAVGGFRGVQEMSGQSGDRGVAEDLWRKRRSLSDLFRVHSGVFVKCRLSREAVVCDGAGYFWDVARDRLGFGESGWRLLRRFLSKREMVVVPPDPSVHTLVPDKVPPCPQRRIGLPGGVPPRRRPHPHLRRDRGLRVPFLSYSSTRDHV